MAKGPKQDHHNVRRHGQSIRRRCHEPAVTARRSADKQPVGARGGAAHRGIGYARNRLMGAARQFAGGFGPFLREIKARSDGPSSI